MRNFHGLASFYRTYIKNFTSVSFLVTDSIRRDKFQWTQQAQKSFDELKQCLTETTVLALTTILLSFQYWNRCCSTTLSSTSIVIIKEYFYVIVKEYYLVNQILNLWYLRSTSMSLFVHYNIKAIIYWIKNLYFYSDHEAQKLLNTQQKTFNRHGTYSKMSSTLPFG